MHLVHDPAMPAADPIDFRDFLRVDMRAGTIRSAAPFPPARHPSFVLMIDFGSMIGMRKSIARITERHRPDELVGSRVLAVVNFPPRQIAGAVSEALVLGVADATGAIALVRVDPDVPDGARLA